MQAKLTGGDRHLELIGHLDGLHHVDLLGVLLFLQFWRLYTGRIAGQHLRTAEDIAVTHQDDLRDQTHDWVGSAHAAREIVLCDLQQATVFQ
jgi:hypothetical protein